MEHIRYRAQSKNIKGPVLTCASGLKFPLRFPLLELFSLFFPPHLVLSFSPPLATFSPSFCYLFSLSVASRGTWTVSWNFHLSPASSLPVLGSSFLFQTALFPTTLYLCCYDCHGRHSNTQISKFSIFVLRSVKAKKKQNLNAFCCSNRERTTGQINWLSFHFF